MIAHYFDPVGRRWVLYDPHDHTTTFVYGVPSGYPHTTTVKVRRSMNHGLHAALSLATLGMWLPVWLLLWLANRFGPRQRTVVTQR